MHRVHPDHISDLLPLFDFDFPNQTALLSCANGEIPGEFFVDELITPSTCVAVIGFYNWTFIGGSPKQEWLDEAFASLRREKSLMLIWADWISLGLHPPPDFTQTINRFEFLDSSPSFNDTHFELGSDIEIRRMDTELFSRCIWNGEMTLAYGSSENFLNSGLGFCLMRADEIYCEAYAVFRANQRFEIGVITAETHRGRGYASTTCSFLSGECARNGFQSSWSCNQTNLGSIIVARRLGYKIQREYQMLHYSLRHKNEAQQGAAVNP